MLERLKKNDCILMTLWVSSLVAIILIMAILAAGVPIQRIEKVMVWSSIPWFVFWNIFCRFTHNLKIQIT